MEERMESNVSGRRDFPGKLTALATGVPALITSLPQLADAGAAEGTKVTYNPAAKFDVTVTEVELRRDAAGRMLMARIYRPAGTGPFPAVLALHGGAWNN